jgi:hypothetical protein
MTLRDKSPFVNQRLWRDDRVIIIIITMQGRIQDFPSTNPFTITIGIFQVIGAVKHIAKTEKINFIHTGFPNCSKYKPSSHYDMASNDSCIQTGYFGKYHKIGYYFMYADGLGLGLGLGFGLDTNSISGHNNRHT